MNDESKKQIPRRKLFGDEASSKTGEPVNGWAILFGIIYILFLVIFPLFTLQGWLIIIYYPLNVIISLVLSIWLAVRLSKGYLQFKQILFLAALYTLAFLAVTDAGDSSAFQGIEVLIGHFRGMEVSGHFLPLPITNFLGSIASILYLAYIGLSIYFISGSYNKLKTTKQNSDLPTLPAVG